MKTIVILLAPVFTLAAIATTSAVAQAPVKQIDAILAPLKSANAPGAVAGGLAIDVIGGSPLVGEVLVLDERETGADAALGSETADGDMHGLSHDEGLTATAETAKIKLRAGFQRFSFDAEVALETVFVLRKDRKRGEKK